MTDFSVTQPRFRYMYVCTMQEKRYLICVEKFYSFRLPRFHRRVFYWKMSHFICRFPMNLTRLVYCQGQTFLEQTWKYSTERISKSKWCWRIFHWVVPVDDMMLHFRWLYSFIIACCLPFLWSRIRETTLFVTIFVRIRRYI